MAKGASISGFPEWLPSERVVEQRVIDTLRKVFELNGFIGIETRAVETGASLEVSLQFTDVALLLGIGSGVVVIAVLLSLLPVIRANPKDILSRMEG